MCVYVVLCHLVHCVHMWVLSSLVWLYPSLPVSPPPSAVVSQFQVPHDFVDILKAQSHGPTTQLIKSAVCHICLHSAMYSELFVVVTYMCT